MSLQVLIKPEFIMRRIKWAARKSNAPLRQRIAAIARRKLARFKDEQRQIDRSQGKLTLVELCERYLKTVKHQKPKTLERKAFIARQN